MVKNTHGGSKHKSQARKSSQNTQNITVEPSGPDEKYAIVTKMYGNGMCQVETRDDKQSLLCHIRGKFRGKNKKHNTIVLNTLVIIGLRTWESNQKNCDLICVVEGPQGDAMTQSSESDGFTFGTESSSVPSAPIEPQALIEEMDFDIDDI